MFKNIPQPLKELIEQKDTIPEQEKVFRAFSYFKPRDTKVIIIGQDPYPDKMDACGLSFSVDHPKIPPSLRNIFKELNNDLDIPMPATGNLEPWAEQGVLLLNTILTTKRNKSLAHADMGWEEFTKNKVQKILDNKHPVVIIAWGKNAQGFVESLNKHEKCLVLTGAHPSPANLHGGFLGGKYFSKTNTFLKENCIEEIKWKL